MAPPDALAAERARERHVFDYYPPSLHLPDLREQLHAAADGLQAPDLDPRPSNDAALSAFAQLGTHRLNAKRAFISLIDSQSQFVLAEATQTVPLGNPSCADAADPLWLGCAVIPRAFGACQCALQSDALVINDLQRDRRFTDLPFAATAHHFRFYAGVPLMSPQGVAIGVYCIIDDVPRHGLEQDQLLFMQDMAAAVVAYLRAARAQDTNRKAEQMVRGLNSFVTGAADLQARDDLNVPRNPATGSPTGSHTSRHDTPEAAPNDNDARNDLLSPGTERMFSRAAHIMRQSSDLDGVIFFDASLATPDDPSESVTDESDDAATHRSASAADESSGSTASSYGYPRLPTCKILGFADVARSSRHGGAARKDYLGLTETSLRRLLKRHPNGKIFNIARQTADNTPMKHTRRGRLRRSTAVEAIVDIASNARSAAIMPLWDHERQRWFAGCLCWTSDPNRQLSHGSDLLYLRAFGNSIMTELGRLDTVVVNRAKASFIESMSHELRSPLHGILGGVEYLLEMRLDAFQTSIVNSISMCGRTLLDTVQNVLEYSRINEYTGPSARPTLPGCLRSTRASLPLLSTEPPTNIRRLTEETVEAVFSGQSYNVGSPPSTTEEDPFFPEYTSPVSPSPVPPTSRKAVRVILDLPVGPCWTYAVQPGVWRRILMNVFGNALRFTDAGFVRVSLSATDVNDSQSRITLTVADSGCGMTLRFLQDGLFEAFSQENSFSSGTGLGMSIVQRLVRSVGGDISVQTKVGTGTVVKIHMVLYKCEETVDDFALAVAAQTKDMNIAVARTIIPKDDETQRLSCDAEVQFHASLTDTLQTWFGIKVTALDDVNTDGSQLVMYPGPSFNSMFRNRARQGVSIVVAMDAPPRAHQVPYGAPIRALSYLQQSPERDLDSPEGPATAPAEDKIPELDSPPTSEPSDSAVENTSSRLERAQTFPLQHKLPHRPRPDRHERPPKEEEPHLGTLSTRAGKDILIVDDNPLNIRLLSAFLNKSGFARHTSAANGLEALNLFKQDPGRWGAVLMDLSMPVMDGVTATKEIRAWESRIAVVNDMMQAGVGKAGDNDVDGGDAAEEAPQLSRKARSSDSGDTVREGLETESCSSLAEATESSAETESSAGTESSSGQETELEEAYGHTPCHTPSPSNSPPPADGKITPDTETSYTDEETASADESITLPPPSLSDGPSPFPPSASIVEGPKKKTRPPLLLSSSSGHGGGGGAGRNNGGIKDRHRVEIVVITGLGSATARFEATNAGADVFMTKPINFGALMKTLKRQLARQ
ncbi:hypothetical protein SLS58_006105 [Diplodia intermedia]|uniref:histidine kinase n=1 Tax=Diplodia intermedia TaxID=856260 RepID=A0ABR3TNV3_9PEZI